MATVKRILTSIKAFLETPLFKLGEAQITLRSVLYFLLLLILLVYISGKGKTLVKRVLARRGMDLGIREAAGSIVRYLLLFVGLLVILQTIGIDLTALSILTGAVGLGIGLRGGPVTGTGKQECGECRDDRSRCAHAQPSL